MSTDRTRFLEIHRAYFKHIHAYCRRRVPTDQVDDVSADVFATVWRRRTDIPTQDTLPWLYGVAFGVISNSRRKSVRRSRVNDVIAATEIDMGKSVEDVVVLRHEARQVLEALNSLRPMDREVLMLSLWEDLDHEEAALALSISEQALRKRLSRARRALIAEYERLDRRPSIAHEGGAY